MVIEFVRGWTPCDRCPRRARFSLLGRKTMTVVCRGCLGIVLREFQGELEHPRPVPELRRRD